MIYKESEVYGELCSILLIDIYMLFCMFSPTRDQVRIPRILIGMRHAYRRYKIEKART